MSEGTNKAPDQVQLLFWLDTVRRDFDPTLQKARTNFNPAAGWFGILLIRSLLGLRYQKMTEEDFSKIKSFFSSQATLWSIYGIGIAVGLFHWLESLGEWALWINIVLLGIRVVGSIWATLSRMLTPGDPYFNSNAYRMFRPTEYKMFLSYFKEHQLTFDNIYDYVRSVYNQNSLEAIIDEHQRITEELKKNKEELESIIKANVDDLNGAITTISELKDSINELDELITVNETGFNTTIDLIYRLRPSTNLFNCSDLYVICAFSLFELVDDHLYRHCEQGTTETPEIIYIHDPAYAHYSSVLLVNSNETIEYATSDREGRTVASYWIDLLSDRVYIYNFHYDSTNESMRGTIESKEMYRLIRGICMHLEERGFLKEVVPREDNNSIS
ncbi:MAG: vacuolar protein sorting-associated family 51 protein [Paenibacillus sp.]|nr:vacuolar protein sorting-associated family 51 protein [Paenibacillus sp.]